MRILESIAETFGDYDGYVLDLWGVVHDGRRPYPGVPEALAAMRAAGKRIAFLTNAPRRAWFIRRMLDGMGLDRALYDGIMSSGEATWMLLKSGADPRFRGPAYHIGPERDLSVVEEGAAELVRDIRAARFLLNTGPDPERGPRSVEPYREELAACRAAGLPMLCVNPDRHVMVGGERILCAGALADVYREMGGEVLEIGKPDPAVYGPTLALLGDLPRHRVVAVGDTPHTDLAGAAHAGLDAIWAMTGLFEHAHGREVSPERLAELAAEAGVAPRAALRALRV
ncbi:MAG: TIGR01459 family HAD-type hydrolase [Rhodovarius sp.]|nr:TIGR01459 family HAD-type hydrolase [Rhodovarius sp.]MCX7932882.1 TIGR01459 family HAD-type hydrolase [Rhodovarius sp.]MDW8315539.1 TIGR01459 family HAD-type hydrolase [Rhodovarius sp.]